MTTGLIASGIALLLGLPAGASPATAAALDQRSPSDIAPLIVGGSDASRNYPGMVSLRITRNGDPQYHICGAILVHRQAVVVNAHCVTSPDGTTKDASLFSVRIGSRDRLAGGVVRTVTKVVPHPLWDWAAGADPVADVAVLRLDAPVWLRPFRIGGTARDGAVRILGWGSTKLSGEGPLPTMLQQLDTMMLPPADCAAGGITAGEICVASPGGVSGACYGDSGGPALRRLSNGQWIVLGAASRETTGTCGTGPAVYTDLTYYRWWIMGAVARL